LLYLSTFFERHRDDDCRQRLAARRISKITLPLQDALFLNPVTTAPRIRDRFQVNFRTAQGAIDDLVGIGVLREITGQRRNRAWMADGILAVISGTVSEG